MFKFENPQYFLALAAIPAMILILIIAFATTRRRLRKLGDSELVKGLVPYVSFVKKVTKVVLFLLAFTSLVLAICNLQTGSKLTDVKREGADIVVCLDVSNSMLAEDLAPNRLSCAKLALEKMIDKLEGDRLGLVIFAGEAYVQLPITTDYGAAKMFLDAINPGMVPVQGTNLADAILKASESFNKEAGKNKAIILITDGENHESEAITVAEEIARKDIMVCTIGIGSDKGVPIPFVQNGVVKGYRKDQEGQTVVTRLNASLLKNIASKGNGVYIQASQSDLGLEGVLNKIEELDKVKIESMMYTDYEDQFQWFIAIALVLLTIEFIVSERVNEWYRKLNLFGNEK